MPVVPRFTFIHPTSISRNQKHKERHKQIRDTEEDSQICPSNLLLETLSI